MSTIDGDSPTGVTIDADEVQEITVDGDVVFTLDDGEDGSDTGTVDSFEDQDLSEWTFANGDSTMLDFSTEHAVDGNYALHSSTGTPDMYSESGLDNYPAPGQRYRWSCTVSGGTSSSGNQDIVVYYGLQGGIDQSYYVYIRGHSGNVFLSKAGDDGGNIDYASVDFQGGVEYFFEVYWQADGTHTLTVWTGGYNGTQVQQYTVNDGTYGEGGVGIGTGAADGEEVWVDDIHTVGDATDTTAPTITNFTASTSSGDVINTFDSDEQLANINCDLTGPESATFYAGDYSETANGDGTYTYQVTYNASTDGDYTYSLNLAEDANGNDGASGESASVSRSTTVYIDNFADADLSEYNGTTSPYSFDGSVTAIGGNSLTLSGNMNYPMIRSFSGLDHYPSQGEEWAWYFRVTSVEGPTVDIAMMFGKPDDGTPSDSDGYYLEYSAEYDVMFFGANGSVVDQTPDVGVSANDMVETRIQWDDGNTFGGSQGDINVIITGDAGNGTQLHTQTFNDTTYTTSDGIGWYITAASGEQGWTNGAVLQ